MMVQEGDETISLPGGAGQEVQYRVVSAGNPAVQTPPGRGLRRVCAEIGRASCRERV